MATREDVGSVFLHEASRWASTDQTSVWPATGVGTSTIASSLCSSGKSSTMTTSVASHASPISTISSGPATLTSSAPTPSSETISQANALVARLDNGHLDLQDLGADSKSSAATELLTLVKHMPGSAWHALQENKGELITSITLPDALRHDPKTVDVLKALQSLGGLKTVSFAIKAGGELDLSSVPAQWTQIELRVDEDKPVNVSAPPATRVAVMHGTRQLNLDRSTPAPHLTATDMFQAEDIQQKVNRFAETKKHLTSVSEGSSSPSSTPRGSVSSGIATPSGTPPSTPRHSVSETSESRPSSVRRDSGMDSKASTSEFTRSSCWIHYEELVNDTELYQEALAFAKSEFSPENLGFLAKAYRFLQNPDKPSFDALENQYLSANSQEPINIPSSTRMAVEQFTRSETYDPQEALRLIDKASEDVWRMIDVDSNQRLFRQLGIDGPSSRYPRTRPLRPEVPRAEPPRAEAPPAPVRPTGIFGRMKAWFNGLRTGR
jgi:hypothetical protein